MINRLKRSLNFISNMGFRYLLFRIIHKISIKTGYFRKKFPISPSLIPVPDIDEWRSNLPPFFFYGKNINNLKKNKCDHLQNQYKEICEGTFTYFGKLKLKLDKNYDWVTNPVSGYTYDITKHWSLINEYTKESGDIKFVWEKSRFSFLNNIIRFDYHFNTDCSEIVFNEIISFIDKNPLNKGPNYICSQEISIRILNWTFALYYYKDSKYLTNEVFNRIMDSIYWQINHVYNNINFSRVAVRNNHALTETLMLFLSGLLYPFFPDVKHWSKKGKKWFEKEIDYQIYDDGTYLQFSNNYHRVVIQLLTWGIRLAKLNDDELSIKVIGKAKKSLIFLIDSMDPTSGMLPNYGANDGALFFNLNNQDYRDYRPQLQALSYALNTIPENGFGEFVSEDIFWMGISDRIASQADIIRKSSYNSYTDGGFYIIHDDNSMTYIRCGNHNDRPSQADNLHLDIWYKGINALRDNGSFLYNSEPDILRYFMGTRSHNTIMLNDYDQMLKGPRFIWYNWSQALNAKLTDSEDRIEFEGTITAFTYLYKNIQHKRKVMKIKGKARWIIEDEISGAGNYTINQLWHLNPELPGSYKLEARDVNGNIIKGKISEGWYSSYYGVKEKSEYYVYSTESRKLITSIDLIW